MCIQYVAHVVLNSTVERIQAACHDPSSPIYPHCPFIASHPRFSLGYIVAKIQPVQVAAVYCSGAGKCSAGERPQLTDAHPDLGVYAAALTAQAVSSAFAAPSSSPFPPHFAHFDESPAPPSSTSPLPRLLSQLLASSTPSDVSCGECVEYFIEAQLKADFQAIAAYCEAHKDDPVVVAECQAIAADVPFVAGQLYAEQEPQKFAAGVCVGAGKCSTDQANAAREKVVM